MITIPRGHAAEATDQLLAWASEQGHDRADLARVIDCIAITAGEKKAEGKPVNQDPELYFPGLEARPWWPAERFPWHRQLEQLSFVIKGELQSVLTGRGDFRRHPDSPRIAASGVWKQLYLFSEGVALDENCALVPRTVQTIRGIPGAAEASNVFFAAVTPGTHIKPHWGPYNTRLRCHLGLIVPEGVSIRVSEETRSWSEGKCLFFDDSFDHEVRHTGSETRYVLILDIWHPDLTPVEIEALKAMRDFGSSRETMVETLRNAPVA